MKQFIVTKRILLVSIFFMFVLLGCENAEYINENSNSLNPVSYTHLISNAEEPIWERKWLTIEEAAAYSGIGRTKLRELSNQAGCPFAIWIGNKIHIVRKRLDKYIDKQFRI